MEEKYFEIVNKTIDNEANFLNHISEEIWKHPELKHEEKFAHDLLTNALEKKGFTVERHYILPTAFRAEYSSQKAGPAIVVICEYDALPKIGHACGHNLIAESGLGAGIAIKTVLETCPEISGKVVVLGTPAEEGGGGKIDLINGGAFKNIDAALMKIISFTGQEAHASGYPWEGINALDAAVATYNNLALLRQHIKPTCRVHAIIKKGGEAANVIPGYSELDLFYRAATNFEMEKLNKRIDACINAAAVSTGCEVSIEIDKNSYQSLMTNKILAERYKKYAEKLGVQFDDGNNKKIPFMASSDMGDVSHVVPSIHPTYSIGTQAANHSVEFTKASGTSEAQVTTLITSKSMAMVALDLMCDQNMLKQAKEQFNIDLAEDAGL
ncbi:peptidase M20 domain-containing protein 2 [Caerostris extrusa]|uniref:Peptidase M20 domain-containing protein 2 n=1 Tax=Caerostris extrusa TaxID=172846 RepID=A0AAV4V2Y9_CAEEX|nr:peptidase M20 domain-containing protein 2 [Caerostris extrusa]